ncbi:small ribosomal subunit protein mS33 [Parasteatoda tepidariorum]|uniref:Small ribosomal subunit protein mS33 n=1 Tax=Parasteatoda tepidariorum TaxID=114398 RepID=A0A2L2Y6N4_PARTP|nr:28S ribosomal protein S33, mitochondrial [Parasteatoda tepidariorum]
MNFLPGMSNYATRMTRLSARIFGEVARPTNNKSMKVVRILSARPKDLDPYYVDHYPPHPQYSQLIAILREHGLFRDEHLDFKEEMVRQKILRGKVKPKPGQGKRAKAREVA